MLSILIPTYNYDCYQLVKLLHWQATRANIIFEIIVANDCSTINLTELNQITSWTNCTLINLQKNIGRAKIRNFLANKAQYNTLLFIDSDSLPSDEFFLKNYIKYISSNMILLGGRIYCHPKDKHHTLLPKYGKKEYIKESFPFTDNSPFTSPNFMIPKKIFNITQFDENIKGYGHEDTIFGISLLRQGFKFYKFNNPIIHIQIENNYTYIKKTKLAINHLYYLNKSNKYKELQHISKLLKIYNIIKKIKFNIIFNFLFNKYHKKIEILLDSKNPSILLFSLYKLLYICHISVLDRIDVTLA